MRKPLSGNANAYTPIRTACLAAYCCYAAKKITRSEAANERQVRLLAPKLTCEPFSPSSAARPVSVAHLARSLGPPRTYSTCHSMRMLAIRAPTFGLQVHAFWSSTVVVPGPHKRLPTHQDCLFGCVFLLFCEENTRPVSNEWTVPGTYLTGLVATVSGSKRRHA